MKGRLFFTILALNLLSGCKTALEKQLDDCLLEGSERSYLLSSIQFSAIYGGTVNGFDLDGLDSDTTDPNGCFQPDFIDPTGNSGIDNSFSRVLDEFQGSESSSVGSYLQETVRNGDLLVLLRITGIDDFYDDKCVTVEMLRAQGPVLVDLENRFLDGQTLRRHADFPQSVSSTGYIENGILYADGLDVDLLIKADEVQYTFPVEEASVRLDLSDENSLKGYFGGSGPFQDYFFISEFDQTSFTHYIQQRIYDLADIHPDEFGVCQSISTSFDFQAIPAHLYSE